MVDVATVKTEVMHICKSKAKDSATMLDGRDTLDNVAV